MLFKQILKTIVFTALSFHGIFSEPHCSKFHYEEKLLEKVIRLEFMVENMKKDIEVIQNEASTTLGNLQTERKNWENNLMALKEASVQQLNNVVEETENKVETELNKLTDAKKALTGEIAESLKRPEVLFSARLPRDRSLTRGQTMVFTEIILNKGGAYNKEDGVFTVPYTGIYMFTVQWCLHSNKFFYFDFLANEVPFKKTKVNVKSGVACQNFDALTAVNKNDSVKIKIKSPNSGTILAVAASDFWTTFSGVLIQHS